MNSILRSATLVVVAFFLSAAVALAGSTNDKNLKKLPTTAQKMIRSNFSKYSVKKVSTKGGTYTATLSNNVEIIFDHGGQWTKVDCKSGTVPNSVVPAKIRDSVKKDHKGAKIRCIEKVRGNYKVKLSTGKSVTYDSNGREQHAQAGGNNGPSVPKQPAKNGGTSAPTKSNSKPSATNSKR